MNSISGCKCGIHLRIGDTLLDHMQALIGVAVKVQPPDDGMLVTAWRERVAATMLPLTDPASLWVPPRVPSAIMVGDAAARS